VLRTLVREFHTPTNWVIFKADGINLGFLDIQIKLFFLFAFYQGKFFVISKVSILKR